MSATVILETLRRHFAHIAYVAAVLVIIVITATMAALGGQSGAMFPVFSLFIMLAGCQIVGPEFSSGTLQLILSKPIHRSRYLLSRVAGVVLALWIAIASMYASEVIASAIARNDIPWMVGGGLAAAAAAQAVLVCSLMAFFGSFTRSYLNVALYLGGQVLLALLAGALQFMQRVDRGMFAAAAAFLRAHPGAISAIHTISRNIYPEPPLISFDRNWLLMVFSNASIALVLACLIFRKREVPYGAD